MRLSDKLLQKHLFRGHILSLGRFEKRTWAVRYADLHSQVNQRFACSPNGRFFGQYIYPEEDVYKGAYIFVSDGHQSSVYEIPSGKFLREYLIDNQGRVAAWILDDAENCHPQIYERCFKNFSRAWHLHWTEFGGIAFNALVNNEAVFITDETELLLH